MDDWEKISETSLPEKENIYSHLKMEDITDADYAHAKLVSRDFEINFRNMYREIYEFNQAKFLSAPAIISYSFENF